MKNTPAALCLIIFILFSQVFQLSAQTKHGKNPLFPTYTGLIMSGYQGWFRTPEDGSGAGWRHYGVKGMFDDDHSKIDIWPDVSEYKKTYKTPFKHTNGETALVFSSYDKSTVDVHFCWMKEYGLDGVFMQRFFDTTRNKENKKNTTVLRHAVEASNKYERAIAVMYDLSGLKAEGEDCSSVIEDWKYLVDELKITGQKTYLNHNGKPIVAIWGVGFPDRPYNIRKIGLERLIDFLKNDKEYGRCTVMLGVPTFWRDLNADCVNDSYLHEIIKSADIILPWMVQRFTPLLHNDMERFRDIILSDMKWCRENGIEYVPCISPGFSWHNLSKHEFPDDIKPVGSIPRQGGRFYWQQLSMAIASGSPMLYVAMFDEIDEATAIFKCSDNPPVAEKSRFIDMDGMPSDHYLWLTGEASKMLKREKPLKLQIPERN